MADLIFFHQNQIEGKNFLTAVSTDSHRMSISKVRLNEKIDFEPIILPKKTIFQLCSLLEDFEGDVKVSNITNHMGKTDYINAGRAYWFSPYTFITCNLDDDWDDEARIEHVIYRA